MSLAAWRLVRAEQADRAFDGEGARLYGGRWNPPGMPTVYAAGSRALAALEVLTHLPRALRTSAFVLHRIEFDEQAVEVLDPATLPADWSVYPPPSSSQNAGRTWLARAARPILRVPSVLIPEESNFLFNPRHPAFTALRPQRERFFFFDPRLG
jgi:RES domain-containing protein